ncbi:MAG: hypothetical protein MI919_42000, partial [Holophagales bacterium]|nr:hypothetical protein [Holophagales bacterium]
WTGAAGEELATFMTAGYDSPLDGEPCPPIDAARFEIEVHDHPSASGLPERSHLGKWGYVDPSEPTSCYIRHFDVESPGATPPQVAYETRNCEGLDIQLRVSTRPGGFDPGCRLREYLADRELPPMAAMDADIMTSGYTTEGRSCGTLREADLWLEVRDAVGDLHAFSHIVPASYTGPLVDGGGGEGPCSMVSFSISRGLSALPVVSWEVSCTESERDFDLRLHATSNQNDPLAPECVRDVDFGGTQLMTGSAAVAPMRDSFYPGCTALPRAWVRLDVVRRATGEVLASRSGEARYAPCHVTGFEVIHQSGELPVIDWQTTCPDIGAYEVRVMSETTTPQPPGCDVLGLWDGNKRGRRPAWYMAGGDLHANPTCPAVAAADFWVEIGRDGLLFEKSGRVEALYDGTPVVLDECDIDGFQVTSRPGDVPIVTWNTLCPSAASYDVTLHAESAIAQPAGCAVGGVWVDGQLSGQRTADFMAGFSSGSGVGPGQTAASCPPIGAVNFWLEIRDRSTGELHRLSAVRQGIHAPCERLSFEVVDRADALPRIEWSTTCASPGPYSVEVLTRTISPMPSGCRLSEALWDGNANGGREADFMSGWGDCPVVALADFALRIRHAASGTLMSHSPWQRATYDTTLPRFDLVAEASVSSLGSIWPGETLELLYQLTNLGDDVVPVGHREIYYLSQDSRIGPGDP